MPLIPNSLNHILAVPQRQPDQTVGSLPLSNLTTGLKAYDGTVPGLRHPDTEAFNFYTLNHLVGRLQSVFHPDEPLPQWAVPIVTDYRDTLVDQSVRLAFYLLLTTTRESRHQHSHTERYEEKHKALFGNDAHKALMAFASVVTNKGESSAIDTLKKHPPDVTIDQYMRHLSYVFHSGKFSGGYGGHPWGNIADCLWGAVNGTYSLEVMVDLGYALAHNNGPVFNKGMLYHNYSGEFMHLLDLQRAGMLPALCLDSSPLSSLDIDPTITQMAKRVQTELGGLPDKVDGLKVWQYAIGNNKSHWKNKFNLSHEQTSGAKKPAAAAPTKKPQAGEAIPYHPNYTVTLLEHTR